VQDETPIALTNSESASQDMGDGCSMTCSQDTYLGTTQSDSIAAFNPNAGVLWPGSLVQSASLTDGILTPIPVKLAPGTIQVEGLSSSEPNANFAEPVTDVSSAGVAGAIQTILTRVAHPTTTASISYASREVHDLSEAAFSMGFSAHWLSGSAKGGLDFSTRSDTHRYSAKFVQRYYSASFSPTSALLCGVKKSDLEPHVPDGLSPVYVSSVDFGRMLFMTIESSADESTFRAALSVAYDAIAAGGTLDGNAAVKSLLESSSASILIIGGSATNAVRLLKANPISGLEAFLSSDAEFSAQAPGAPISYTARYIGDSSVARVSFSTDYTVKNCGPQSCLPVTTACTASLDSGGGRFIGLSCDRTYVHASCPQSLNLILDGYNQGNDWCDFVVKVNGGSRTSTGHFTQGHAQASTTVAANDTIDLELWTPGIFGIPGNGGGSGRMQIPACGDVHLTAVCR
jgi:thiol-activated cytolysin